MAKTDITKVNFLYPSAFVALGGMAYVLLTLLAVQSVAAYWEEGRMIEGDTTVKLIFPLMALAVCGFVVWLYVRRPGEVDRSYGMGSYQYSRNDNSNPDSFGTLCLVVFVLILVICFISVGADLASFLIAIGATSTISYFVAFILDKHPSVRGAIVGTWFVGYVALWTMGSNHALNLPAFIAFWVVFGGLSGYFLSQLMQSENIADKRREEAGEPRPRNATGTTYPHKQYYTVDAQTNAAKSGKAYEGMMYRRKSTSGTYSEFGRIPQDTANLMAHFVRRTTGPIAAALPVDAPSEMIADTVRLVLDCLMLDWHDNNNLGGLDDNDVQDIKSFVVLASSFVTGPYDGATQGIYKATLTYLLKDWLDNWNADGVDGPPR